MWQLTSGDDNACDFDIDVEEEEEMEYDDYNGLYPAGVVRCSANCLWCVIA